MLPRRATLVIIIPGVQNPQTVLLPEAFLNRMELAVLLESFDCGDLTAVRLHGEHGAGLHRLLIEDHRARTAVRRVAPDVRARQPQLIPQEVDEQKS